MGLPAFSKGFALVAGMTLVLWAIPCHATSAAEPPEETDVLQQLQVVNVLLRDGHPERAMAVLNEIDPNGKTLDRIRFRYLRGLASQKLERPLEALIEYEQALMEAAKPPIVQDDGTLMEQMTLPDSIFLLIGQCAFQSQNYEKAAEAMEEAKERQTLPREAFLILSQSLWKLEEKEEAWRVLEEGREAFQNDADMIRLAIFMRCDLHLFQTAFAEARTLLALGEDLHLKDVLLVGESMRTAGALEKAAGFLEEARLRFPESSELGQLLARTYLEWNRPWMAAMRLEELSHLHPELIQEAAEMYRKAGRPMRALFLNEKMSNQEDKMKQRLGILLELERFEEVTRMESRMHRLGLVQDDQIRYALAYASYRNGELTRAEKNLRGIADPKVFEMGIRLREAIQTCREGGWLCE